MSQTTAYTSDGLEAIIQNADKPVLIDFWAEGCGPCSGLAPIIEQIAEEYADKLIVGKVDIGVEPEPAQKYMITAVPCVILFKGGAPVARSLGFVPKEELLRNFVEHL